MKQRKIQFLVLTAFSSIGGIEKFNRAFIKALVQLQIPMNSSVSFSGLYDHTSDEAYVPSKYFQPYFGKRMKFVLQTFLQALKTDELILGHVNLALVGVLFKILRPQKKLTVICHGIEVFEPVSGLKKKLLQKADQLLAVSSFTKNKLIEQQQVPAKKINVFPNTLDPYFQLPTDFSKPHFLKERYDINENEKVIFTLTRLNSEEGYKGYDKVISILPQLIKKGVSFKYILAGKADAAEKKRMQTLIEANGLQQYVLMPGFIADEEVTAHYLLADVFVMPSKGEGFGIVYVEAMACGLPVIAGNKDGSTEALQFGELGTLIDPDNEGQLLDAISHVLKQKKEEKKLQAKMLSFFSFEKYTERLRVTLEGLNFN